MSFRDRTIDNYATFGFVFLIVFVGGLFVASKYLPSVSDRIINPAQDSSTQCSRFNYQDDVSCVLCSDPGTKATVLSCVKSK